MAGRTISAGFTGGIALAVADNPLTVTATGSVGSTDAAALTTAGTADWVIDNAGSIVAGGTVAASVGIMMTGTAGSAGGTITNQAGGVISGGHFGIYGLQATTLANAGAISATGAAGGVGVVLGTGSIANTGGTILGSRYGAYFIGPGTVSNTGSIAGTTNAGVVLNGGGRVENTGPAAQITGQRVGVYLFAGGSVSNTGSIGGTGTAGYGVLLKAGGTLDNGAGATVTGGRVGVAATGTVVSTLSNAGALSGGVYGAGIVGAAAAFTNAPSGAIAGGVAGVLATAGGSVGNAGNITGRFGVLVTTAVGTVTNSGSIASTGKFVNQPPEEVGAGIQMRAGGTIVNEAGGRISGFWIGAQVGSFNGNNLNGGAVLNAGTITANDPGVSGAAVWFKGEGLISNAATGTIAGGPFGIVSYNKVTIANRGLIGGGQFAVTTSVAGNGNRIIVYPGATFQGTVLGDAVAAAVPNGVLELGPGGATGTIAGFGAKYRGFARVEVAAGATWSLAGTVASGQTVALAGPGAALTLANPEAVGGVITGFDATTGLVLGGVGDVTGAALGAENVLTLTRAGGGTIALRLDPAQVFAPGSFVFAASGGSTALSAPCFALGTRIATPGGEVAVESLAPGMRVVLARGGTGEVVWVGHRRVDCGRHPRPLDVWPVRVAAGAFAGGLPARDLLLSPDHAVFWDGVLIPVRHLVNGRTVRQEAADAMTYFHVELATHDVLLAERLGCESYLDTGNRAAFANGGAAMMLHPDFARRRWRDGGVAALVEAGPAVAAARSRLLARAGALGHRRGRNAGLAVLADGVALPVMVAGARRSVALPEGVRGVAIVSRTWVPAEMATESEDTRRLGVAVGRVALDGATVAADDARLGAGWHAAEQGWRWNDGEGWLHPRGARQLAFEVAMAGLYWQVPREAAAG